MVPVLLLALLVAVQTVGEPSTTTVTARTYSVDPMTVTIIGGMLVNVISNLVTGVVTIITAMRVTAVTAQQQQTAAQVVTVARDTEAIKGHVNSEKTAATGREAALQQEIRLLREMLADKTVSASLLAQAAAGRIASRATDTPGALGGVPAAAKTIEKIDATTERIETKIEEQGGA